MTAEEAAMIMMSDGNVPQQSSDIVSQIANLPIHYSYALPDGWVILFSVDLDNAVTAALHTGIESATAGYKINNTVIVPEFTYVSNRFTRIAVYGKFIKNGKFMFAVRNSNNSPDYNKEHMYSANYIRNDNNEVTDITVYHNSDMEVSNPVFSGIRVSVGSIYFTLNYTENWTYYDTNEVQYGTSTNTDGSSLYLHYGTYGTDYSTTFSDLSPEQMWKVYMDLNTAVQHYLGNSDFNYKY